MNIIYNIKIVMETQMPDYYLFVEPIYFSLIQTPSNMLESLDFIDFLFILFIFYLILLKYHSYKHVLYKELTKTNE